jgi:hypothetical protein
MRKGSHHSPESKHRLSKLLQGNHNLGSGSKNHRWRGGINHHSSGYIMVMMKTHPNATKSGYVLEHVLVMTEHLGRPLEKGETVHHKDGDKHNNRIENLELWVRHHPPGQRVEDLVTYCLGILRRYEPERVRP